MASASEVNVQVSQDRNIELETKVKEVFLTERQNDSHIESTVINRGVRKRVRKKMEIGNYRGRTQSTCSTSDDDGQLQHGALAAAIQRHMPDFVEAVQFSVTRLPDLLVQDGCLTEDECRDIRHVNDGKDQVRLLVMKIKARKPEIIESFLTRINKECKTNIKDKVLRTYREKKRSREIKCALCRLTNDVDIKPVADYLYSEEIMSDQLYRKIVGCPPGGKSTFWREIFQLCRQQPEWLLAAIHKTGFYSHIAEELADWNGDKECICPNTLFPGTLGSRFRKSIEDCTSYDAISIHSELSNNASPVSDDKEDEPELLKEYESDSTVTAQQPVMGVANYLPMSNNTYQQPIQHSPNMRPTHEGPKKRFRKMFMCFPMFSRRRDESCDADADY